MASLHCIVELILTTNLNSIRVLFKLLLLLMLLVLLLMQLQLVSRRLGFGRPVLSTVLDILLVLILLSLLKCFTRNSLHECLLLQLLLQLVLVRFFTGDDNRIGWTLGVNRLVIWTVCKIICQNKIVMTYRRHDNVKGRDQKFHQLGPNRQRLKPKKFTEAVNVQNLNYQKIRLIASLISDWNWRSAVGQAQ